MNWEKMFAFSHISDKKLVNIFAKELTKNKIY